MRMTKKIIYLFALVFVTSGIMFPLHAEEGKLAEAYPPNVKAANFKLSDIKGDKHELNDYRGKHVIVNFWSMSCNLCKSEMTTLQSAYELIDDKDLVILSIHAGNSTEGVESVLELNKVTYPVLFDVDLQLGDWGIPIMPTSFIVSPDGDIRYRVVGTRVWNSPFMIDFIKNIMNSDEPEVTTQSSSLKDSLKVSAGQAN